MSIQLRALPNAPVLIEVFSGAEPPLGKPSLSPDLAVVMKTMGFTVDAHSGNYQRVLKIRSMRDIERTALLVLDVLYDGFNYRGLVPIDVEVAFGGRASETFVYRSFAPQEIAEIATRVGYEARVVHSERDTATIVLRRGAVVAEVVLGDRAEDSNLFASGLIGSPLVPAAAKRGARMALLRDQPRLRPTAWRIGVTLWFDGGVTAEWVGRRIEYGMKLVAKSAAR